MLVSTIPYMHCFLSRLIQCSLSTKPLNSLCVTLFSGFCFSWFLTYATVEALGRFLSLHLSGDSPWLERQELSDITFLNLLWHADQSFIIHLLCLILPVYLLLKAKLSHQCVCEFLAFFGFQSFYHLVPHPGFFLLRQIKVGWVLI